MNRSALITGITGQDGSYLAELLLSKGYRLHGATRRLNSPRVAELFKHLRESGHDASNLSLHACDLNSLADVEALCRQTRPDEIYNLAAQSHVGESFEAPVETFDANARGVAILLEAIRRRTRAGQSIRLFQAGSSEVYGTAARHPQTESTPFHPRSPYACSKVCAFHQVVVHRETFGLFACDGILYNHESPRRPERFVTRKITRAVARIATGSRDRLRLGNLDVGRDWGYAPEYVDGMWRRLQCDQPDDYILATNDWRTLEEFVERAFSRVGLDWRDHVDQDPAVMRHAERGRMQGDATRAWERLGWKPRVRFEQLVDLMVDADLALASSSESGAPAGR